MLEKILRSIPRVGDSVVESHPSANKIFGENNLVDKAHNLTSDGLRAGGRAIHKSIKESSMHAGLKILSYIGLGGYKFLTNGINAVEDMAYGGVETTSRVSESALRGIGKLLDMPGKYFENKNPQKGLGKIHMHTANTWQDVRNFVDKYSALRIPKDIAVLATALAMSYTLATETPKVYSAVKEKIDEISFVEEDSNRDESKEIALYVSGAGKVIGEGDMLDIGISFKDTTIFENNDTLKAKYFLVNKKDSIPLVGSENFYDNLIPLGEEEFNAKEGVSKFFVYSTRFDENFDKGSERINPLVNSEDTVGSFEFLVEIWNGREKLTHKTWGENFSLNKKELEAEVDNFQIDFDKNLNPVSDHKLRRVDGVDDKKVFMYYQKLGSTYLKDEILTTADYIMPHYWDINTKNSVIIGRVSEESMKAYTYTAHEAGAKVIPMLSAFKKKYIKKVLENPQEFAEDIVDRVQSIGADGVTIDLESIKVGSEYSDQLVKFMRILKNEFNKEEINGREYEVAIAVSPRYNGSSEKAYKHHGFYDYGALDTIANVDFINIMGYDFNTTVCRPGLPENEFIKTLTYAIENISPEKIVYSGPMYGRAYDHKGKVVGIISEKNNDVYFNDLNFENGDESYIRNGEHYVKWVKDKKNGKEERHVYMQTPEVQKQRLELFDRFPEVNSFSFWRANNSSEETFDKIQDWKVTSTDGVTPFEWTSSHPDSLEVSYANFKKTIDK